jgi:anti-sigma B factor antagonist
MSSFFAISEDVTTGEIALIAMAGEIDYAVSPQLRERIFEHIEAGRRHIVLDLSAATFIDSTAIGVLAGAVTRLRGGEQMTAVPAEGAGSLAVVCPDENDKVGQILRITGLDAGVGWYGSREEALSGLALTG